MAMPVGCIVAWHNNIAGVPALPDDYQRCDGSEITDPESPLLGLYTPDLNNPGRFIRGSVQAGGIQDDMIEEHNHARGSRKTYAANSSYAWGYAYPLGADSNANLGAGPNYNTSSTGGTETRPKNMSVVWIMRIK